MTPEELADLIVTQLCAEPGVGGECDVHGNDVSLITFNGDTTGDTCCPDCLREAIVGWFEHINTLTENESDD